MSTLVLAEQQSEILASLRRLKGRGTAGDVIADSGLPGDDVRSGLKALLESHRGHLAVADSGELVYEFEPGMIERGTEPFLARARRAVGSVVRNGFKAWIVIMLVVYFAVMVALVIAASGLPRICSSSPISISAAWALLGATTRLPRAPPRKLVEPASSPIFNIMFRRFIFHLPYLVHAMKSPVR